MAKGTLGFFYLDERLAELSAKGDDLERVKALVDFEMFRGRRWRRPCRALIAARAGVCHLIMCSCLRLIFQAMHSLSDERCEYLIKDRLTMAIIRLGFKLDAKASGSDEFCDMTLGAVCRKSEGAGLRKYNSFGNSHRGSEPFVHFIS